MKSIECFFVDSWRHSLSFLLNFGYKMQCSHIGSYTYLNDLEPHYFNFLIFILFLFYFDIILELEILGSHNINTGTTLLLKTIVN